jgi:hypothetical protein
MSEVFVALLLVEGELDSVLGAFPSDTIATNFAESYLADLDDDDSVGVSVFVCPTQLHAVN